MTSAPTLVSHDLCPYVQRAAISLAEKQVSFERIYIDLGNKPDWFLKLSPLGKVPLLIVGDNVIFESAVILEYLEDTEPRPLHPEDPLERADHRAWMEYASAILNDIAGLYNAPDKNSFAETATRLSAKFRRLENRLAEAPWFAGENFSLVDAVYAPVFRYFDVFDQIGDFEILKDLSKIALWRRYLKSRQSILGAVKTDYPDRLKQFLTNRNSYLSSLIQ